MLVELLEKAVKSGSDCIEIEYKDGKQWVTALSDCVGYSIGCLDSREAESLFKEMKELKKAKHVILGGGRYRLVFSQYESFGEWAHRIQIKMDRPGGRQKSPLPPRLM